MRGGAGADDATCDGIDEGIRFLKASPKIAGKRSSDGIDDGMMTVSDF